jgi:biopolymer transport protein ExbD
VIFQLLIYFVVTANFMIDEGVLTADLPQGSGAGDPLDPPEAPLYIELQSAPSGNDVIIQVGQSQMTSFSQLTAHLNTLIVDPERGLQGAYLPDNPVIIRPQAQVRWQHVVNAFNSGINARFENINFAAGSGGQ